MKIEGKNRINIKISVQVALAISKGFNREKKYERE